MKKKDFRFYWEEKPRDEINIEMPGFSTDEIRVSIEGGFLKVSAEKKGGKTEKGRNFFRQEAFQKSFMRSVSLPEGVKPDELDIKLEDGAVKVRKKKRKVVV